MSQGGHEDEVGQDSTGNALFLGEEMISPRKECSWEAGERSICELG